MQLCGHKIENQQTCRVFRHWRLYNIYHMLQPIRIFEKRCCRRWTVKQRDWLLPVMLSHWILAFQESPNPAQIPHMSGSGYEGHIWLMVWTIYAEEHLFFLFLPWTSFFQSNFHIHSTSPDSKVHGANMGPTWVLSALCGPHVGPMNLAIGVWLSPWPHYLLALLSTWWVLDSLWTTSAEATPASKRICYESSLSPASPTLQFEYIDFLRFHDIPCS